MTKPAVLIIGPYPDWDMVELENAYQVHKLWEQPDRDAYLRQHGNSIRAIATRGELGASRMLMDQLPQLEAICCYGVGTDAIDLAAARERGVRVSNTPDVLTEDVADIAIALMLAVARQIPQGDAYVRSGEWATKNMGLVTRMCGKRLGVIGMGRIGAAVARRASGFDMQISYSNRHKREDSPHHYCSTLTELAANSDFLVATVAGGKATASLITADVFKALGPQGYFINVARGSVVDEAALLDALEQGQIKGAGLDVFLNEPRIDPRFAKLNNVVLQPHHGSGTVETRKAMGQLMRDNLAAHFAGRPLVTAVV